MNWLPPSDNPVWRRGIVLCDCDWPLVRDARIDADDLMPLFDPARTGLTDDNAVAVVGLDHDNRPVLTGGCVLRLCPEGLAAAVRDMSLFSDRIVPGEFASIDADPALLDQVRGRIVVIGAVWCAPLLRGGILRDFWPLLVGRAVTSLQADWIVGLIRHGGTDKHRKLGFEIEGFRHFWEGLHYRDPDWGGGYQIDDFVICAMSRQDAISRILGGEGGQ